MDFTPMMPASRIVSSACDIYIASIIAPSSLVIRSATTLGILRVIALDADFVRSAQTVSWAPVLENSTSRLLLACNDKLIYVYDAADEGAKWTIDQASTGIKHVEWTQDAQEILVVSHHQLLLTIWPLNGKGFVVPNPKFSSKGHASCLGSSRLAILQRELQDRIVVVDKTLEGTWSVIADYAINTVDAQGLLWSPDGQWIAVWDHATDYKVSVYTACGTLARTYTAYELGLGVQTVAWSPSGDYLAIGSFDNKARLLNTFAFAPVSEMCHSTIVRDADVQAWREVASASVRRYDLADVPVSLPTARSVASELPKAGVTSILFSPNGDYMATRSESTPTTLWVWSLVDMAPVAILVHSNVIKSLQWHPDEEGLLVFSCQASDRSSSNAVYLWNCDWTTPKIIEIPQPDFHMHWFETIQNREAIGATILFGSQSLITLGFMVPEDSNLIGIVEEDEPEQDWQQTGGFEGSSSLIIHESQAIVV